MFTVWVYCFTLVQIALSQFAGVAHCFAIDCFVAGLQDAITRFVMFVSRRRFLGILLPTKSCSTIGF